MIDFDTRRKELETIIQEGEAKKAEIDASLVDVRRELRAITAAQTAFTKEMGIATKRRTGVKKEILSLLDSPKTRDEIYAALTDVNKNTLANALSALKKDGLIILNGNTYSK